MFKFLCSVFFLFVSIQCFSSPDSVGDPYVNTDYPTAFDQQFIWNEFSEVLNNEGLSSFIIEGAFSEKSGVFSFLKFPFTRYQRIELLAPKTVEQLEAKLVKNFLKIKHSNAYLIPSSNLKATLANGVLLGSFMGVAAQIFSKEAMNMGTGFSAFVVAENAGRSLCAFIQQYYKLKNYKGDPLLEWELRYVKNKRFLPKDLWSIIEDRFMQARTNSFGRESHFLRCIELLIDQINFIFIFTAQLVSEKLRQLKISVKKLV